MKLRFAIGMVAAGLASGATAASFVELTNESAWAIHELYVSTVSDEEWGPDQMRDQIIETGGTFRLSGIPCDDYDVRIVDEDGDACVLREVTMCDNEAVTITDEDLLGCQANTDE